MRRSFLNLTAKNYENWPIFAEIIAKIIVAYCFLRQGVVVNENRVEINTSDVGAGPRLWNSLPISLRQCRSLEQFKRLLKTFLFSV